ncbi:unnamed protein product [Closterium sp. Naga37s-1]|nr:unnamed protein product [Closterium sp. Naga37s-1]
MASTADDAVIDVEEDEEEEELPFRWGDPAPGPSRGGKRFYLWFEQGGERFDIYDCVYCQAEEGMDPYVGKIVRMYELPPSHRGKRNSIGGKPGERKVDIRWFFRAADVQAEGGQLPRDVRPNEVFLAVPEGTQGVTDANKVIVVDSRARILCVSEDQRNPQPSAAQVESAELVFCRAWDMQQKRVLEDLQVAIDDLGSEEAVFNKPAWVQQQPTSGATAGEEEDRAAGEEAGNAVTGGAGEVREEKDGAVRNDRDVNREEMGMEEERRVGESGGGEQKRLSKRMKVEGQVGEKVGKQSKEKKAGDPWDLEEDEEEGEEEAEEGQGDEEEEEQEEEGVEEEEGEEGKEEGQEGGGNRSTKSSALKLLTEKSALAGQAGNGGPRQGLPQGLQPAAAPDGPSEEPQKPRQGLPQGLPQGLQPAAAPDGPGSRAKLPVRPSQKKLPRITPPPGAVAAGARGGVGGVGGGGGGGGGGGKGGGGGGKGGGGGGGRKVAGVLSMANVPANRRSLFEKLQGKKKGQGVGRVGKGGEGVGGREKGAEKSAEREGKLPEGQEVVALGRRIEEERRKEARRKLEERRKEEGRDEAGRKEEGGRPVKPGANADMAPAEGVDSGKGESEGGANGRGIDGEGMEGKGDIETAVPQEKIDREGVVVKTEMTFESTQKSPRFESTQKSIDGEGMEGKGDMETAVPQENIDHEGLEWNSIIEGALEEQRVVRIDNIPPCTTSQQLHVSHSLFRLGGSESAAGHHAHSPHRLPSPLTTPLPVPPLLLPTPLLPPPSQEAMLELFSDLVAVRVQPSTTPIPPIAIHAFAVFRTAAAAAAAVLFLSAKCVVPSHSSR